MPCQSLVYVSRSRLDRPHQDGEIDRIVEVSQARNAGLGVTGALIATHYHFAQILEGPQAAIEDLMASIFRDIRHDQVTVIRLEDLPITRFSGWSMAYSGTAGYVDRDIAPLFGHRPHLAPAPDSDRLVRLFKAFIAAAH